MIFLTVGTVVPFDRLARAVDAAVATGIIQGPVFAQIGESQYKLAHMEFAPIVRKGDFDRRVAEADYLIGHAGMGTINLALERHKRLIVMPRRHQYHEHVNDHQLAAARKFGALGHVLVAYEETELPARIQEVSSFVPMPRASQADAVARVLADFVDKLAAAKAARESRHRLAWMPLWPYRRI